jgi:dienelactone hydrolase
MPESLREASFSVENVRGDAVHGDLRWVEDGRIKPVVVFCHGFKGFKDWGPFPAWGRSLARSGFAAVHFNFSYNGVTPEAPTEFTALDEFARNTYTRELDDVDAVLSAVAAGGLVDGAPIDPSRIGLMGHSRGGGIAILQAARDDRVDALATWAAVSGFVERFTDEQIEDWTEQGYTEVVNSRTGQVMRLDRILYDDALQHREGLDVGAAASGLDTPWLIVHASDDSAVSFEEAERLASFDSDALLVEAEGGHTFGGAHPHDGSVPDTLQYVWDRTAAFFNTHLFGTEAEE